MKLSKIVLSKEQVLVMGEYGKEEAKKSFSHEHNLKGKLCKFCSNHLWYLEEATPEEIREFSDLMLDCATSSGWHGYLDW